MTLSLDTETCGLDVFHGCSPYFVTTCDDNGEQRYWEWDVNPLTRKPVIPEEDVHAISELIKQADILVLQNSKFDITALQQCNPKFVEHWDWSKVRDTLYAGHLLASNQPHNLTAMGITYTGDDIEPYEKALQEACQSARRYCRRHLPKWRISKEGISEMPSAGSPSKKKTIKGGENESTWKADGWLPRAVASYEKYPLGDCPGVVNYHYEACHVRIDRSDPSTSGKWGNPFTHLPLHTTRAQYQVATREEAIYKYKQWIKEQSKLLADLHELDGKILGCTCKMRTPSSKNAITRDIPCHGDVLADLIRANRHPWWDVLSTYANADSETTLAVWLEQERMLHEQKLWLIYENKLKLLPISCDMERVGVTYSGERLQELSGEYRDASNSAGRVCTNLAKSMGYALEMPKGASPNDSLRTFMLDVLKVPHVHSKKAKTSAPTLNADAMKEYLTILPKRSKSLLFVKTLLGKRSRDTSLAFMENYNRFAKPLEGVNGYYLLHPSINCTGTNTLRWSCSNPNTQNLSKQGVDITCPRCRGDGCTYCKDSGEVAYNTRYLFGPAPGREWWSLDAQNIELRYPYYKSGEKELIDLFERPNDPPYYGSNHLLNFHTVYDEIWNNALKEVGEEKVGPYCKKEYKYTWYQWCKNGGFACVPMNTEALTRSGWKKYEELCIGDNVLGWRDGKLIWTPVLNKFAFQDAPLIHLYNGKFSVITTPDHRWWGKRRTRYGGTTRMIDTFFTTEEITTVHEICMSAQVDDTSLLPITPVEAAIIGFAYGDGSVVKSNKAYGPARGYGAKVGFRVRLWQSKQRGIDYIKELLRLWGGKYRHGIRKDRKLHDWELDPQAMRSLWKRAGLWETQDFEQFVLNLGTLQRSAFLEAVWQAEGHINNRGKRAYTQNGGRFAEGIKLAIYMEGHSVRCAAKKNYYPTKNTCYQITEGLPKVTGQRLVKESAGKGDVWCIETGTGTWVMRQGSVITLTGNCQYSAGSKTADAAFHKQGAHALLKKRFAKIHGPGGLNEKCIKYAEKYGYVETVPDSSIDPNRGYPIWCTRTEWNHILPTVPLNYWSQGSACQWMAQAMIRVYDFFQRINKRELYNGKRWDGGYHIVMQIHDELVLDMPSGKGRGLPNPYDYNLPLIRHVQKLMEKGGEDTGVPTPVGVEYHESNWSEGVTL